MVKMINNASKMINITRKPTLQKWKKQSKPEKENNASSYSIE